LAHCAESLRRDPRGGKKKAFSKNHKKALAEQLVRAFLDRAGERATDLLSRSRADKRVAEIGTKRSTAEHEQKHGVEQSTASSRAVSKQHVRTRSGSSCRSHLQLTPKNFGLRRCDLAPEAPIPLAPEGHKAHRRNGRIDDLNKVYKQYYCCW
jgi:hypothetical protein